MKSKKPSDFEKVLDLLIDKMEDKKFGPSGVEKLCQEHPNWAEELRKTWEIWYDLGTLESPPVTPTMREQFYDSLHHIQDEEKSTTPHSARKLVPLDTVWKWAAIFVVGLTLGMLLNSGLFTAQGNKQLQSRGQQMLLSKLTSGESASDRLSVVQGIKNMSHPRDNVFEALYTTLINDPNVNVRLSSIETLLHFADQPKARELLVNALAYQDSPIVQITLAEVLIKLQEEGTLEEIKKLLYSEDVDIDVKMHLEETLNL